MTPAGGKTRAHPALVIAVNLLSTALLLALVEGAANLWYVGRALVREGAVVAERLHTEYDPDLGWINRPSVRLDDMYGRGKGLYINLQRLRSDHDFTIDVPPGKVRVVCSGDSFTFGYGVDNAQTWCHLLATLDPRLETVNMGQGGYGVDQAYLWYKRDGRRLKHDVQILAFITNDFLRMGFTQFLGYEKPMLHLEGGTLVVDNVPVPRRQAWTTALVRHRGTLEQLGLVRFLQRVLSVSPDTSGTGTLEALVSAIVADLKRVHQAEGSLLVLVYLPQTLDTAADASADWRRFLHLEAARQGVILLDLVEDFRRLPVEKLDEMFIAEGVLDFMHAAGHYTEWGNMFVARTLLEKLDGIPEVQARLGRE